jgi:two-component system response regulator CpxR
MEVRTAFRGPEGVEAALRESWDLVLLDVMLPGLDGFEVLKKIRESSQVPVLMLTGRGEKPNRIRGLEGGADDYLPKPFDPQELLARVRAVLRRAKPPARNVAEGVEANGVKLDPKARSVSAEGQTVELTTIEFDILEMLLRAAGRVVSRDEISRRLYNRDAGPFDRSIDVHISHVRRKLGGTRERIRTVRGSGYQFLIEQEAAAE